MSAPGPQPQSTPADGARLPWWLGRRARLLALLACLAAAGTALIESRTGLLEGGGSATAQSRRGCPPHTPSLATVGLAQVKDLRLSLLAVLGPLSRRRYAWGTARPEVAWTDGEPQHLGASRSSAESWPASYEMRVWVAGRDNVAADVFLFATGRQAAAYFAAASSSRCHPAGRQMPASGPPGGRNLIWRNPDGPTQQDLFLLRGARVYRIADVRVRRAHPRPASVESTIGLHVVNTLGCALAQAGCLAPGTSA